MLETYQELVAERGFEEAEPVIGKSIKKILEGMANYIQFDKIVDFIDMNYGQVPFSYFKEIFIGMLSKYSF